MMNTIYKNILSSPEFWAKKRCFHPGRYQSVIPGFGRGNQERWLSPSKPGDMEGKTHGRIDNNETIKTAR